MPPLGASRKLVHWNSTSNIKWFYFTSVGFWLVFDEMCLRLWLDVCVLHFQLGFYCVFYLVYCLVFLSRLLLICWLFIVRFVVRFLFFWFGFQMGFYFGFWLGFLFGFWLGFWLGFGRVLSCQVFENQNTLKTVCKTSVLENFETVCKTY